MSKHMDRILAQGVVAGLLKPHETSPGHINRPWPLTVLTGIGAWFAAIPIAILIFLLAGTEDSAALAIFSAAMICAATFTLRQRMESLFMEQLALAALVGSALALGIFIAVRSSSPIAAGTMLCVSAAVAVVVPQAWLRTLLGAAMGVLGMYTIHRTLSSFLTYGDHKLWAMLGMSTCWCLLCAMASWRRNMPVQRQAWIEALIVGMGATLVCSPFWSAGLFMFGEVHSLTGSEADYFASLNKLASVAVAVTLASACYMPARWVPLRTAWFAVASAILIVFTWYVPSLSVLAVVAAVSLTSGRRSLAILCVVMLVWRIGSFYYSLRMPLIDKAMLLAASGLVLAATTAFLVPVTPRNNDAPAAALARARFACVKPTTLSALAILASAVLTLGIANVSIMQKEALTTAGTTIFVELKPVDPRSLMQGDYMRLSFGVGALPRGSSSSQGALIGEVDLHAVWTAHRVDDGTALAADEIKINLSGTPSHPIFVTDAWFFKEGEASRWESARYGEFRVDATGKAVLITLRGKDLEEL
jgi:uncharacterized membrane-anchored protein